MAMSRPIRQAAVFTGIAYDLPRLATVMPRTRAWVVTGAIHACFHLPLLLLTTTYQSAGQRVIVMPMVLVTITAGGVIYAWIREASGSIWPVTVMHNAFNTYFDTLTSAAVTSSAATRSTTSPPRPV